MYTGCEFLEGSKSYKKYVNVLKLKITFKKDGWSGGGVIVTETKPNTVYGLPCLDIDDRIK